MINPTRELIKELHKFHIDSQWIFNSGNIIFGRKYENEEQYNKILSDLKNTILDVKEEIDFIERGLN